MTVRPASINVSLRSKVTSSIRFMETCCRRPLYNLRPTEADQRLSGFGLEQFRLPKTFGTLRLDAAQAGIGREKLLAKRRNDEDLPTHFSTFRLERPFSLP